MKNLPFNLCIAFLACFLMNFVSPAFSSPTPTPTATIIPTPTVTATTTVTATPTPQPPTVTTGEATVYYGEGCLVTLNGTVNANGLLTTVWFEYGETSGSYSSTTATQTVSGTSDTAISNELEVSETCNNPNTHYYRLVAQNSAGKSYGNENSIGGCYIIDCFGCSVSGYVTDATTEKGIEDATILINGVKQTVTDERGYYDYRSDSYNYNNTCGELEVTALANGYTTSTEYGYEEECSCSMTLNFILIPTLPTTPTPTVSTTPASNCVPESISASQSKLTLKRKQSKDVTVTVKSENDCLVDDETVTARTNKTGKKCISILPESATTGENGEATFVITAKRVGNARVIIKAGSIKITIIVKVRR